MSKKDELVLDPNKRDIQRVVTSDGRCIHNIDKSDRLNPILEAARASGIGELSTSEDTVSCLEAIIKGHPGLITTMHCGGMTNAMRMASLHADPVEKLVLLESLEELEGLADGRVRTG